HFALVFVTSGLHKLQFGDWWSGAAFWYPFHPLFEATYEGLRAEAAGWPTNYFFYSVGAYALLAWQIGFPLFAWRRGWWRVLLLGGALVGWVGSVLIFREPLFGPVYAIACLSFLTAAEWRAVAGLLGHVFRRPEPARTTPAAAPKPVKAVVRT